jgi:hypothetical protein
MEQQTLFDAAPEALIGVLVNTNTCLTCAYRERWQMGGSIIQYCGARKSNRTSIGLLKIKCKTPACQLYKNESLETEIKLYLNTNEKI